MASNQEKTSIAVRLHLILLLSLGVWGVLRAMGIANTAPALPSTDIAVAAFLSSLCHELLLVGSVCFFSANDGYYRLSESLVIDLPFEVIASSDLLGFVVCVGHAGLSHEDGVGRSLILSWLLKAHLALGLWIIGLIISRALRSSWCRLLRHVPFLRLDLAKLDQLEACLQPEVLEGGKLWRKLTIERRLPSTYAAIPVSGDHVETGASFLKDKVISVEVDETSAELDNKTSDELDTKASTEPDNKNSPELDEKQALSDAVDLSCKETKAGGHR